MVFNPLYGYAAALLIGASSAWYVQGLRYSAQIAKAETAISAERAEAMRLILAEQGASTARMAAADKKHTEELTDAKGKIAALELRVANGTSGLRVAARCPSAKPVPEAGSVASVGSGDGESAELDGSSRPDYYALFEGILELEAALKICVEGS